MAARTLDAAPGHVIEISDDALPLLDDALLGCVEGAVEWAAEHDRDFGVRLRDARARRWQSIEDPSWVEPVLTLTVHGQAADALRFWEGVSAALDQLADARRVSLVERLALEVDWR